MGLESVFKLSLIMSMVDNLTSPLSKVQAGVKGSVSKLQRLEQGLGNMTKTGLGMAVVGDQITSAALAPVEATFETRRALGELASLGVKDLGTLERAAADFSSQWAGTTKAEFISAAYDIKSGIASLSDEGVAQFTELSGLTAKATKSTVGEMTSLFATGYGIYKDYYSQMSDMEFGEMFSAGIAKSVQQFKTTGSGMAQAIESLGASATTAKVPMEEQLAILGMLQATMSGSEAGTKYNAFLKNAAKGGEDLGLNFLDANNQLLSMPEILDQIRGKFGETMDATEKIKLQEAFGDQEAVALIDLLYSKTGELQDNILSLYDKMGQGRAVAEGMANAINQTEPDQYQVLTQQIQNVKETMGNSLLPTVNRMLEKGNQLAGTVGSWAAGHQELVGVLLTVALVLGGFLTAAGSVIAVVGGVGLVFTKTGGLALGFIGTIRKLPDLLETIQIYGLYAGDGIKKGFTLIKAAGSGAVSGVKLVGTGIVNMGRQAITAATTALPPLIASVWSFTAALLANPITWVVLAVIALIAVLVLLYNKCEWFRDGVNAVFGAVSGAVSAAFGFIKDLFGDMMTAYEEHGGGMEGAFAAAMTGIQGLALSAFNFMDQLTGGKMSAIAGNVREKLDIMQAAYEEHGGGARGAWAAAMAGIQAVSLDVFNFIDSLTGGKISSIIGTVKGGIEQVKSTITGAISWFRQSGAKIMDTFTEGIKSAVNKPVQAVKGGLQKIRNMLPFSDAKTGPLSTLTLSGKRTMSTYAEGIRLAGGLPGTEAEKALLGVQGLISPEKDGAGAGIEATREPSRPVFAERFRDSRETVTSEKSEKEKGVSIRELHLNVDLKSIKELPQLLKLLREVEDFVNSGGTPTDDLETVEEG